MVVTQVEKLEPLSLCKEWMNDLAEAVAFLESLNLAHGDLRPENILLDRNRCILSAQFHHTTRGMRLSTSRVVLRTVSILWESVFLKPPCGVRIFWFGSKARLAVIRNGPSKATKVISPGYPWVGKYWNYICQWSCSHANDAPVPTNYESTMQWTNKAQKNPYY
jgi:serine/threonine protein kinase